MTRTLRREARETGSAAGSARRPPLSWWRVAAVLAGVMALAAVAWLVDGIGNVYETYGSLAGGWVGLFALFAFIPIIFGFAAITLWRRGSR